MSNHPLLGTWDIITVMMIIEDQHRTADSAGGRIFIGSDGTIFEEITADFGRVPVRWYSTGTYRIEGQNLVSRATKHSLKDYERNTITRRFEFHPESRNSAMMLYFRSGSNSMAFGLKRTDRE